MTTRRRWPTAARSAVLDGFVMPRAAREVLTCPRGWRWSRRAGECQWAGRGDCPPWQMRNGRCLTQLTCRGGVVRQSGRGLSCHCPPGMAAWGNYPLSSASPRWRASCRCCCKALTVAPAGKGGRASSAAKISLAAARVRETDQIKFPAARQRPFNGKNGSRSKVERKGSGKTGTTTVIDPKTGNKTVTKPLYRIRRPELSRRFRYDLDKNGRPLSIKGADTQQTAAPGRTEVRPQTAKTAKAPCRTATSNNAATLKAQQDRRRQARTRSRRSRDAPSRQGECAQGARSKAREKATAAAARKATAAATPCQSRKR